MIKVTFNTWITFGSLPRGTWFLWDGDLYLTVSNVEAYRFTGTPGLRSLDSWLRVGFNEMEPDLLVRYNYSGEIEYHRLADGEAFLDNGKLYVKVNNHNAINLGTRVIGAFCGVGTAVTPVSLEIEV